MLSVAADTGTSAAAVEAARRGCAACGGLVPLSAERDLWMRRLLRAERDSYRAGWRAGRADGRAEQQNAEPIDVSEPGPWPVSIDPALDRLRYPPHGRRRFGEPRPGDYLGIGGAA